MDAAKGVPFGSSWSDCQKKPAQQGETIAAINTETAANEKDAAVWEESFSMQD